MGTHLKNILYVPLHERTKEWACRVADELIDSTYSNQYERDKVRICRQMYRKGVDETQYDYLYQTVAKKVEDECGVITTQYLVPPAKVRNIPIIRSMIRRLVSGEKDRPKIYRAFTTDAKSAATREDKLIQDITMRMEERLMQRIDAINMRSQMLAMQQEMLAAQQQQGGQPDPQSMMLLQQLGMEINRMQTMLQQSLMLEGEELEKLRSFYKYDYKSIQELMAETVTNYLLSNQNLHHIFNRNFEEYCVTGKEIFHVDWEPGMDDPVIEQCFFEEVYFPYNQNVNFLFEHSWAVRRQDVSTSNIIARWGQDIDKATLERIRSQAGVHLHDNTRVYYTPTGVHIPHFDYYDQNAAAGTQSDLQTLYSVYFKVPTLVPVIESKNKHRDTAPPFIKKLDDDEADYYRRYPEKLGPNRRLLTKVKEDLYRVIRVGSDTYIKAGLHPVQHRDMSKKSLVSLPFIGHAEHYYYANESIIWETKDIQELYNVLFYQKELLIVLAGVRGIVVDMSQMDPDMELQEVIYYMRQGILPIRTLDEDGRPKNTTFNQWASYDQTLSPAIQYIEQTLVLLKQLAGEITGITDIMQGIVRPTDQVGTTQMAMANSSQATERYYQEHEQLLEMVFTKAVNLAQHAYKKGKIASFVLGDQLLQYLKIPPGTMEGEFKIIMENSRRHLRTLDELHQASRLQFQKGQIQASQFLTILDTTSIREAKQLIAEYEEKALKMMQAVKEQDQQAQRQLQQEKAALDQRTLEMVEGNKNSIEQMRAQIETAKLQIAARKNQEDAAIRQQEIAARSADVAKRVETEAAVEMNFLELERQKMLIDDQNTKAAMLLEAAKAKVGEGKSKEKVKDK